VIPTDVFSVATTTAAMGAVCSAEGRTDEAERLYSEAIATIARTGFNGARARIEVGLADHLIRVDRPREARALLLQTREIAGDEMALRARREVDERLRRLEVAATG
jgi:hypothetical protein